MVEKICEISGGQVHNSVFYKELTY